MKAIHKRHHRFLQCVMMLAIVFEHAFPGIGLAVGPYLVKEISPGSGSSLIHYGMAADGDARLFFGANDGTYGPELWVSDGTEAGTYMVSDLQPGTAGEYPRQITCTNGLVFFTLPRNLDERELWRSDGTAEQTFFLNAFTPPSAATLGIGDVLFFRGSDPGYHYNDELWRSDGTIEGTWRVKDLNGIPPGSSPTEFTDVNGTLFFRTSSGLWKSDGTEIGTVLVGPGVRAEGITNVNGRVFFTGSNDPGNPPDRELWVSDGTTLGTYRVKDIFPGQNASRPSQLTAAGSKLFFNARRQIAGPYELWVSDGTEEGTIMVDGTGGSRLTSLDGVAYFWRFGTLAGWQLWKSDGTPQGTVPTATIVPASIEFTPDEFVAVNNKLFFAADDGVHGLELWCYNPEFEVAFLVADIWPGPESAGPILLTRVGTGLFFEAWNATSGGELWSLNALEPIIPTLRLGGLGVMFTALLLVGAWVSIRNHRTAAERQAVPSARNDRPS